MKKKIEIVMHGEDNLQKTVLDDFSRAELDCMEDYLGSLGWTNAQIVDLLDDLLENGEDKTLNEPL